MIPPMLESLPVPLQHGTSCPSFGIQQDPLGEGPSHQSSRSSDRWCRPSNSSMLQDLQDEVLVLILEYATARDVESWTVAWRHIGEQVLPKYPIWKMLFVRRWNALNFGVNEPQEPCDLQLDPHVLQVFNKMSDNKKSNSSNKKSKKSAKKKSNNSVSTINTSCAKSDGSAGSVSESRVFQLLTHATSPVPSFADLQATNLFTRRAPMMHIVEPLAIEAPIDDDDDEEDSRLDECHDQQHQRQRRLENRRKRKIYNNRHKVIAFAFGGYFLGGDRSVRSNVPFTLEARVVVYKVGSDDAKDQSSDGGGNENEDKDSEMSGEKYSNPHDYVGLACSGYFEITIISRPRPLLSRYAGVDMTSIGLCTSRFHLIDKQPGWDDQSYGYHGDDGKYFHATAQGRRFGPAFGVGDVVGCGVIRDPEAQESSVFFTKNGELIERRRLHMDCQHGALYPTVGLDSPNVIQINFGQMPFQYDFVERHVKPEMRRYGEIMKELLEWNRIVESDADSASEGGDHEDFDDMEDSDSDYENNPYEDLEELMDHEESRAFLQEMLEDAIMDEDYDEEMWGQEQEEDDDD